MAEHIYSSDDEDELLTETQLNLESGNAYDIPNDEGAIYRHLTDWHLTVPQSVLNRHMALPDAPSDLSTKKYILFGKLVALNNDDTQSAKATANDVPVRIDALECWAIDRDTTLRGIWVQSSQTGAWYLLKQPCQHQPQMDLSGVITTAEGNPKQQLLSSAMTLTATLPMQEDLHIEYRAKLGLISNLADLFLSNNEECSVRNSKQTPEALHAALTPTSAMIKNSRRNQAAAIPSEPFDLKLLQRYPQFVHTHIRDLIRTSSCKFLTALKHRQEDAKAPSWTDEEFRESAEASEARGGRHSWGELLSDGTAMINPNSLYDYQLEAAQKTSHSRTKRKATPRETIIIADSDEDEIGAFDSATFWMTKEQEKDAKVERQCQEKKARAVLDTVLYDAQRMKIALKKMASFLTSEPPADTLEDVTSFGCQFASPVKARAYGETSLRKTLSLENKKDKLTWEHKILVALAVAGAAKDDAKFYSKSQFFRNKNGPSVATILFETWREEAVEFAKTYFTATTSMTSAKDANTRVDEDETRAYGNSLVVVFLTEIASLIRDCKIINSAGMLEKVKKNGVGWEKGLMEMSQIAFKVKSGKLTRTINDARARLRLLRVTPKKSAPVEEEKKSCPRTFIVPAPAAASTKRRPEGDERGRLARERRKKVLKTLTLPATHSQPPSGSHATVPTTVPGWAANSSSGNWTTPKMQKQSAWPSRSTSNNSCNRDDAVTRLDAQARPPSWAFSEKASSWGSRNSELSRSDDAMLPEATKDDCWGIKQVSAWPAESSGSTSGGWGSRKETLGYSGGWGSNKRIDTKQSSQTSLSPSNTGGSKTESIEGGSGGSVGPRLDSSKMLSWNTTINRQSKAVRGREFSSRIPDAKNDERNTLFYEKNNPIVARTNSTSSEGRSIPQSIDVDQSTSARSETCLLSMHAVHTYDTQSDVRKDCHIRRLDTRNTAQCRQSQNDQRGYSLQQTEYPNNRNKDTPGLNSRAEQSSRGRPLQAHAHARRISGGRGRGREMNLPAWMTRGNNLVDRISEQPLPDTAPIKPSKNAAFLNNDALGNILKMDANPATVRSSQLEQHERRTDQIFLPNPNNRNNAGIRGYTVPAVHRAFINENARPSVPVVATCEGRGRGRGKTLPAWMTRGNNVGAPQLSPISGTNQNLATTCDEPQHANTSNGRGRGRGRTLPAWMTRNENP